MKTSKIVLVAGHLAGAIALAAALSLPVLAAPEQVALETVEVTATVAEIDHETRAVTLRTQEGEEHSFIASDEVRNLDQVAEGDVVTVTYTEALAYEVMKGGAAGVAEAVAGGRAEPGARPAGAIAHEVVVTVEIIAIDLEAPSVTFRGPRGNTRTVQVLHPEKLKGVSVGDTVDITYTEAFAIRVDPAQ